MARWTSQNATVKFIDGTGIPVELTLPAGPGDLNISEMNDINAEVIRVNNRGAFDGHVVGDDLEQTWSITIELKNQSLSDAVAARIADWIMKSGLYSGNTSVSSDPQIWAFKVQWNGDDGAGNTAQIELPLCVANMVFAEAKEGSTLTISGTNNGAPVIS